MDTLYQSQISTIIPNLDKLEAECLQTVGVSTELIHTDQNSTTVRYPEQGGVQTFNKPQYQFSMLEVSNWYNYARSWIQIQGYVCASDGAVLTAVDGVGGVSDILKFFRTAQLYIDGVLIDNVQNMEYIAHVKPLVEFSRAAEPMLAQEGRYIDRGVADTYDPRNATGAFIANSNPAQFYRYQRASMMSTYNSSASTYAAYQEPVVTGKFTSRLMTFRVPLFRIFDSLRALDRAVKGHTLNITLVPSSSPTLCVMVGNSQTAAPSATSYRFALSKIDLWMNKIIPPAKLLAGMEQALNAGEKTVVRFQNWTALQAVGVQGIGGGGSAPGQITFYVPATVARLDKIFLFLIPQTQASNINGFKLTTADAQTNQNFTSAAIRINGVLTQTAPFTTYTDFDMSPGANYAASTSAQGDDLCQIYTQYLMCCGRDAAIRDAPMLSYDDFKQQIFFPFDCTQMPEMTTSNGSQVQIDLTIANALAGTYIPWIVMCGRQVYELAGVGGCRLLPSV